MTLEAWIYPTVAQTGWRAIVQKEFDTYFLLAASRVGPLKPGGRRYLRSVHGDAVHARCRLDRLVDARGRHVRRRGAAAVHRWPPDGSPPALVSRADPRDDPGWAGDSGRAQQRLAAAAGPIAGGGALARARGGRPARAESRAADDASGRRGETRSSCSRPMATISSSGCVRGPRRCSFRIQPFELRVSCAVSRRATPWMWF